MQCHNAAGTLRRLPEQASKNPPAPTAPAGILPRFRKSVTHLAGSDLAVIWQRLMLNINGSKD
jgi:hypothetical protein